MSFEERLSTFVTQHDLNDDAVAELLKIWNSSLIDVERGILKECDVAPVTKVKPLITKKDDTAKKWASKTAGEFAIEKGVTLDDFETGKISKKDVENFLKAKDKNSGETSSIKCHGLTKKGEPCNRNGTKCPDGAKFQYCFRHADDYKDYELSSDSSEDELEPEEISQSAELGIPNKTPE